MKPIFLTLLLITDPLCADTLTLGAVNGAPGAVIPLPVRFLNTHQIVAMQFDLGYPAGFVEAGSAVAVTASTNHKAESRDLGGKRRVVLYSLTNQIVPDDLILEIPVTVKAGGPAGGPSLTLSNLILTNKQGQSFVPTVNYPQLDAWQQAHFTAAERANPAVIGDDRDPDGDGVVNLMEFIMGTDPKSGNGAPEFRAALTPGNGGSGASLTMTFRTAKGNTVASVKVETSKDLLQWSSDGVQLVPTGQQDAVSVEYAATVPAGENKRQFLRASPVRTQGN